MGSKLLNEFRYSLEKKPVDLFAQATIGSSGAITLSAANSKGITSITKKSTAGQYTVVFKDAFQRLMDFNVKFIAATGVAAAPHVFLVSRTTTGCVLQCCNASGTSAALAAGNPGSDEVMLMTFTLSDSSAI